LQHGFSLRSAGTPQVEPAIDTAMFTNAAPPGSAMFARRISIKHSWRRIDPDTLMSSRRA